MRESRGPGMPGPYKPAPQVKSAEQILVVAELDVAGALDGEGVGLLPVGQGHIAVGIQPLQDARIVAAALLVGADQMRRALLALELLVVLGRVRRRPRPGLPTSR